MKGIWFYNEEEHEAILHDPDNKKTYRVHLGKIRLEVDFLVELMSKEFHDDLHIFNQSGLLVVHDIDVNYFMLNEEQYEIMDKLPTWALIKMY